MPFTIWSFPTIKKEIVGRADKDVLKIQKQYMDGLITDGERYNKVIDIWAQATEKIAAEMMSGIATTETTSVPRGEEDGESFNPIFMMADSGARGSAVQIRQLGGYARSDGQTVGRNHRNADYRQFP